MIRKILCGLFVSMISLNASAATEVVFCYEKIECPADGNINRCQGTGKNADIWASATRVGIGSGIKKGTYVLQSADSNRSARPLLITASCSYGSVVLQTTAPISPTPSPKWIAHSSFIVCNSSNPSECPFQRYY